MGGAARAADGDGAGGTAGGPGGAGGRSYGGLSLARTAGAEDDRTALLGSSAVTYMVSPATDPPVITVTTIRPPKGQ